MRGDGCGLAVGTRGWDKYFGSGERGFNGDGRLDRSGGLDGAAGSGGVAEGAARRGEVGASSADRNDACGDDAGGDGDDDGRGGHGDVGRRDDAARVGAGARLEIVILSYFLRAAFFFNFATGAEAVQLDAEAREIPWVALAVGEQGEEDTLSTL